MTWDYGESVRHRVDLRQLDEHFSRYEVASACHAEEGMDHV